jgi:hypothetical protein
LNIATIAALARAPMPPAPTIEGAVSNDTFVRWTEIDGATDYIIRWRRTDASQWEHSRRLSERGADVMNIGASIARAPGAPGDAGFRVTLRGIRVDDWVFGVSSVAADGSESPVASAVPGGAFVPYTPPPPPPAQ